MQGGKPQDILDRLGFWGAVRVVWRAIPWPFRLLVFPHFLLLYSGFFKRCTNLDEVRAMHLDYYDKSRVFRPFRPRFHVIKGALLPLVTPPSDVAVRDAAKTVRHVAWMPNRTRPQSESSIQGQPWVPAKEA